MRTALVFATLIAALAAGSAQGTSATGLRGIVTRGPTSPVCKTDEPCTQPARYTTIVFAQHGVDVARTRTSAQGTYRIRLRAGVYSVREARPPAIGRGLEPGHVRVVAGRMRRIDFSIDTGIR